MTGCGAVGSALPWGGRGRGFKSRHSDHNGELISNTAKKSEYSDFFYFYTIK